MTAFIVVAAMLLSESFRQFAPDPPVRTLDWCLREIKNDQRRPYSHSEYPHLGAPGGPMDANDDPTIRRIVEMFASRLGKTFFGQCVQLKAADTAPCPMMLAASVEKLALDITARTYRMAEQSRNLRRQLMPERLRRKDQLEFESCRLHLAWSRSVNTLADKNIKIGHAAELDKWTRAQTSTEAEPLFLFLERFKDFVNYKVVLESTPTVAEVSRIEALLKTSSNCRFNVPCPNCQRYQVLHFARLKWDRLPNGEHDVDVAGRTARYHCDHCNEPCHDHHRAWMMRRGVWLPHNCQIDHEKALEVAERRNQQLKEGTFSDEPAGRYWKHGYAIGEPTRDGSVAGYQLSSLYALSLTWGRIAEEWISVYQVPVNRRNFINSWLGETFREKKRSEKWESLARRLIVQIPRGMAPLWASLLTMGIDRQKDHYKWVVDAWGPGGMSHTMDYGRADDLRSILKEQILRKWQHADGGTIEVARAMVDAGFDPEEPYTVSKECLDASPRIVLLCCHGSSRPLQAPFKITELDERTIMPGLPYVLVDGDWTQLGLERQLHELRPGESGAMSVFEAEPAEHEAFFRELLNDEPIWGTDRHNNPQCSWDRITEADPNDHRDCRRYSTVGQLIYTEGKPILSRDQELAKQMPQVTAPRLITPDGRPFMAAPRR